MEGSGETAYAPASIRCQIIEYTLNTIKHALVASFIM